MSVIENFSELSEQELQKFASDLVAKINAERILTSDADLEVEDVEADEMTGGLYIYLTHEDGITIERDATWQCADEDNASNDPGYDAEYDDTVDGDALRALKTKSTVIDGYSVAVSVSDAEEGDTTDVRVDRCRVADDGIGHYEYFGFRGYDSHSYVEVTGTIVCDCSMSIVLFVEPVDEEPVTEPSEE